MTATVDATGWPADPLRAAQDMNSFLGKLVRTANPAAANPIWEIIANGLRNPWRFSFDRLTGDLLMADVGQDAWEEVDYRPQGSPPANYGWSRYEGNRTYNGDITLDPASPLVFPVFEYPHSQGCSVTGGYVYRGTRVADARGRYFFGDYCSGTVWSLRIEDGKAVDVRRESFRVGDLSSFGEDARGELYLVSLLGPVYRLSG